MNTVAKPRSRLGIRKLTNHLRELIGYEDKTYFPIVEFIEWILGDPENKFDYEIVPAEEMEEYSTTNTGSNVMLIREDVYLGAVAGNPRDRFTLCHELGHYFLHQPENISFARGNIKKYQDPEWQANVFAAELMAPYNLVKDWTVEEIMEQCGMSKQAAKIQKRYYQNDVGQVICLT